MERFYLIEYFIVVIQLAGARAVEVDRLRRLALIHLELGNVDVDAEKSAHPAHTHAATERRQPAREGEKNEYEMSI